MQTGLALIDTAGVIVRANPACAGILGRANEDLVGLDLRAFAHPDDLRSALGELEHLLRDGRAGPIVARLAHPTEEWVWVRANSALLPRDPPVGFVVIEDVTAEQHAVEAMHLAEALSAQRMAQQAAVAALGRTALSGTTPGVIAQRATDLVVETLRVRFAAVLYDDGHPDGLLQVAGTGPFEDATGVFRRRRDESWVALLRSRAPLVVSDVRDLPEELDRDLLAQAGLRSFVSSPILSRRVAPGALLAASDAPDGFSPQDTTFLEAMANVLAGSLDAHSWMDELRHQALHDTLTGLPNRALLLERLDLALHRSARGGTDVAVLVCDLDRFKVVNDGLGHAVGDLVLRTVAERLTKHVRPGDTVGRFGGDEFVIVCPHMAERHEVERIAQRLACAFEEPIVVAGTRLVITASIGISLGHVAAPGAAADLLRDADAAMYRAKSDGRSRFELFDDDMRQRASRRLIVETELRRALDGEELVPHYQPIISLRDHRPVGVEALARWNHPSGDVVGPIEFLTVARDAGLLPAVGSRILEEVARDVARWMEQPGWVPHWTAVNLAPSEIADPSLLGRFDEVVARTGADPNLLRIEVTEESLLEDTVQVGGVLDALRSRGLGISVDDFGTGYSSLAYLKRLPVDALKLDRAFVHGLGEDDDDTAIASAVVQMGHALRLQVVAEGVETEQQLEVLRCMGCDLAQGYLIARPMPAAELETWFGAAVTD